MFVGAPNPSDEETTKYIQAVDAYNTKYQTNPAMKAPCLCLVMLDGTPVRVLQSARHIPSNNPVDVLENAVRDEQWFVDMGFNILRVKIECCDGNLESDVESWSSGGYYEAHVRVRSADDTKPLSEKEIDALNEISRELSGRLDWPAPLSFNETRHPDGCFQRYINVRHSNHDIFQSNVKALCEELRQCGFVVVNRICELVMADSCRSLDHGWLEFDAPGGFRDMLA